MSKRPECYYWPKHGFYTRDQQGSWITTDKETVRMKLIRAGVSGYVPRDLAGKKLSNADLAVLKTIEQHNVRYAGPIAGQRAGFIEACGHRLLVTESPASIEPKRGGCPLWEEIIAAHYGEQSPYLIGWLKAAWERLRRGGGPMLPALIIAGAPDLGKSLLQNYLVTPLLGGRAAKPWRYWTGETQFNEDLFGAEHLFVEDFEALKSERRALLGDMIKAFIANETNSLHPKGDKALTAKALWAITISTNLEPHSLRTLPLLNSSLNDKLLVLHVHSRPGCLPSSDDYEGYTKFTAKLLAELPAFAGMLARYELPKQCKGQRSFVAPYRAPEIMELVSEDDAVPKLLWILDDLNILGDMEERQLTAMDLEKELLTKQQRGEVDKLLRYTSLGHLLREAAKRFPERVNKGGMGHNNITRWKLLREPDKKVIPGDKTLFSS